MNIVVLKSESLKSETYQNWDYLHLVTHLDVPQLIHWVNDWQQANWNGTVQIYGLGHFMHVQAFHISLPKFCEHMHWILLGNHEMGIISIIMWICIQTLVTGQIMEQLFFALNTIKSKIKSSLVVSPNPTNFASGKTTSHKSFFIVCSQFT